MKIAKGIALLGLLAMTSVLIYGFAVGDFGGEGSQLLSMPWGIVSLVDLYVGFVLFSGWIVYREKSAARSVVWVVLMMVLGCWRSRPAAATGGASGWAIAGLRPKVLEFHHGGMENTGNRTGTT